MRRDDMHSRARQRDESRNPVGGRLDAGASHRHAIYTGPRDPKEIVVTRQREEIRVNPKDLLHGGDVPLEPGDTVEIKP